MRRIRVAVVTDALYPWHKGGKEVRYLHLLNELPKHEMDIVVYSMKWWDKHPKPTYSSCGSLTYRAICPRLSMYRGPRRSITQAILFAISTLRLVVCDFDIIEADHMPYLQLVPLRLVAWYKRVPLVITWHEVWGRDGWRSYLGSLGIIAASIERLCVRLPDTIIAVSPGTAEKLITMGAAKDKIRVVPNAIDLDRLKQAASQESAPELLFVGRLISHKHAEVAVEATRILVQRGLEVQLGIVGIGPEESRLRRQVDSLNLNDCVTFFGLFDTQDDLWSLVRGSRVLLAPSIREGYGIIVAESLALGTPVVCALHDENESSKMVSPSIGTVIPPLDALALADAAESWLNDVSSRDDRAATFLQQNSELSAYSMAASYALALRESA